MRSRRRLLLLLVIILLMIVLGWILYQDVGGFWSHNNLVIAHAGAVVVIALFLWYLRSNVELQPDPFFLNLTFFAFAAQCIRTVEALQTGKANRLLFIYFGAALVLLGLELVVIRKHGSLTILQYEKQLKKANLEVIANAKEGSDEKAWPTGEINRWAKLLVKISGTDFLPGSLWLLALASMFEGEPKEKSKDEAVSILPEAHFIRTSKHLELGQLKVPDTERRRYGFLYILFAALSWLVFVGALFASR
ncbi:MAG: hypothetical protein H7Z16_02915 [Pyrinomonadaceae bacterium]|nr:hypothetical protein [Pyrinomonadaceae bacterium]